ATETRHLTRTRRVHAGLDHSGGLATLLFTQLARLQRRDIDVQVDAIEKGAGDACAVAGDHARVADALAGAEPEESARTRIHRRDEHERGRETNAATRPADVHLAILQRLTQRFQGAATELR